MAKLTRAEVMAYFRCSTQSAWINPQGGESFQSRSISSSEVAEYVLDLEQRLTRLAVALADHLEGKPVKPE